MSPFEGLFQQEGNEQKTKSLKIGQREPKGKAGKDLKPIPLHHEIFKILKGSQVDETIKIQISICPAPPAVQIKFLDEI